MFEWLRTKYQNDNTFTQNRVRLTFAESWLPLLSLVYTHAFLGYLLYQYNQNIETLYWMATVMATVFFRLFLSLTFWKQEKNFDQTDYLDWEKIYSVTTIVNSMIMGFGYFYFFPKYEHHIQMLLLVFSAGFVSGAIANYPSSPKTPFWYTIIILSSLFSAVILNAQSIEDYLIGSALVLFGIVMIKTLKKNSISLFDQQRLKIQFENVAKNLKETNNNLLKTQKEASEQQKMAAIGVMSAGVAHEINNPLAIIKGHCTNVEREMFRLSESLISNSDLKLNENDQKRINKITSKLGKVNHAVSRISGIIKGLKTLSRDGSNDDFKQEELKEILLDTIYIIEGSLKTENIELSIDNIPAELKFDCRGVQICQVLANLLVNAKDALIECEQEAKWIKVKLIQKRDSFKILVIDNGPGIPEKIAEKIMTPFFTTKETGKGTGLGLSISKKIIEEHGGKFRLECPENNTTFSIELPYVKTKEEDSSKENLSDLKKTA